MERPRKGLFSNLQVEHIAVCLKMVEGICKEWWGVVEGGACVCLGGGWWWSVLPK